MLNKHLKYTRGDEQGMFINLDFANVDANDHGNGVING